MSFVQHRKTVVSCCVTVLVTLACAPALLAKGKDGEKKSPIVFSPAGGVFTTNVPLKLSARAGSPTVRYTLDGSEPDESSPVYAAPLLLTNTALVRARAFPKEGPPGATAAEVYTLLSDDLANFSSNIPLVIVNSFGTNITHERKIEGAVQFIDGGGTNRTRLTSAVDFSGRSLLNVRGRASLRYPKPSYTVKLIDGDDEPAAASLLGFAADQDWVLYAPYPDKALIRDVVAYELSRDMDHWAPHTKFVEVFANPLNGKLSRRDYLGVYVLVERVKRSAHRVNISKLKVTDNAEPEITGGYIFKKDHIDQGGGPMGGEGYGAGPTSQSTRRGYPTGPGGFPGDPKSFQPAAQTTRSTSSSGSGSSSTKRTRIFTNHLGFASTRIPIDNSRDLALRDELDSIKEEESFKTTHTNEFFFVEPEQDELTAIQKAWLKRYLNQVEAALYGPDFMDASNGYPAYLDADSFIDYHLMVETTKNVDGFRFSVFFHKDRGGKIKADPIWDWNLSFGNANGKQGWLPEYWMWPQLDDKEYTWYRRLFEDPDFAQRYVDRWSQLRTNAFDTKRVLARVDELAALLQESQKRNFERWPIMGRLINPNYAAGATYDQEIAMMKDYIERRFAWIEHQFLPVPRITLKGNGAARTMELSAGVGEIYFKTDGTDPRASGGGVSKSTQAFTIPLPLKPGTKLMARTRDGNRWSGPLVWSE